MNDLLGLVKGGVDAPVTEQEQHAGTSATTSAQQQQASEESGSGGRGLLSSLSRKRSKSSGGKSKKRQSSFDIEAPAVTDGKDPDMDQFYAQVALIKALMGDIKEYQKRLENSNEKTKVAVRTAEVHALREQMQQDANTISKEAEQIKTYLKDLDAQNAVALKKKGCGRGSASERTRTAITGALKKKLKELMGEFQDLRVKLQNDYKETVERRVYTVTGEHASEEQIERMIDEGEGEMIFQNAIMEQGRGYVLDTLAEIRERRDAVLDLEKSLMELHQIFLDMAVLVEAQGQMIDNIEAQVNSSLAQVETGVTHLAAAKQSQKRSRKMICCILIMILIAAIAVAIILAITLTK
mmetsp:Transcript_3804/g.7740  ORF Transcript_3804/g.7740 Transcript_3804/m.7740 type:complete len:353 (+) Transcript_3804:69-1127(+)